MGSTHETSGRCLADAKQASLSYADEEEFNAVGHSMHPKLHVVVLASLIEVAGTEL